MAQAKPPAVLVVEDQDLIRMAVADMFAILGYEVIEAADAGEAQDIVRRRPDISLVFTDIEMPGEMDGIGLAQFVRETSPDTSILVTSGRRLPSSDQLPAGSGFISKPYSFNTMIEVAEKLMTP